MIKTIYILLIISMYSCGNKSTQKSTINKEAKLNSTSIPPIVDSITNSFKNSYQKDNPSLIYTYNEQIHNYSKNWDLDNDGIKDELFFVGTGGTHLYFYLRIILSSDKLVRNYNFLNSDSPYLPAEKTLTNPEFNPTNSQTNFAVSDFDKNGITDLYICLDPSSFQVSEETLNQKGIKTKHIILTYKNGKEIFKDFESNK